MPEHIIGLMGAMPDEIAQLYALLTDKREETCAGVTFYSGSLSGRGVVLCCAGMGKVNAAAAAQLLVTKFNAGTIVFSGIAGNMTDRIGVGDVVIGETLLYHDAQRRMIAESYPHLQEFRAQPALVRAAEQACAEAGVPYIVGRIATGDDFVGDSETKRRIAAQCQPDCVEMEGAAVAHVACKNDVPFLVLRTMSDNADEKAYDTLVGKPFDIADYCNTSARICARLLTLL